jgi:tetratricopeptide (TPR) repeat protein
LLSGDFEGAYQVLETLQPHYYSDTALLAMVLHSLGRVSESRTAFELILLGSNNASYTGGVSYHRGLYYAWTGNRDLAFDHLQLALESGHRSLAYVLGEPLLYSLHDDARWLTLLEQIGLLPYWLEVPEQYGGPAGGAAVNATH